MPDRRRSDEIPSQGESASPDSPLLPHLETVERIVSALCRRHSVTGEDADDFGSWVKLKLMEDDHAVFRRFRGDSSMATYLAVVIAMLFRDYRVSRWGRWRPSAEARRQGPLAVHLETLVRRDGLRLEQAAEILRTSEETDRSDRELATLLAQLPARASPRPLEAGSEPLAGIPSAARADERIAEAEAERERAALEGALAAALSRLPPEERVILRMRYWEGLSVAAIARGLDLPQKPLYRRIDRALGNLRRRLERAGVTRELARTVLQEPAP